MHAPCNADNQPNHRLTRPHDSLSLLVLFETVALALSLILLLFGLEKAMLFREKWAHHLGTWTQIHALRLQYLHGDVSDANAARHARSRSSG